MARLPDPQDPLFRQLNSSIDFDRRLWPQDIAGSRAHVEALRRAGVLTDAEAQELDGGLERVAAELEREEFAFSGDDEDIHMAIERRLTELVGPVGGKLHTGRSRNDQVSTDVALYVRERAIVARELIAALMARLLDLAERHADWTNARLHPHAASPARLPGTSSTGLPVDAAPRRDPLPGRGRRGDRRDAAGLRARWPGSTGSSTAAPPPTGWGSPRLPRTRSTPSPAATSPSTTSRRPPSAPPTSPGWARSWCCGRARSSGSASTPTRSPRARA